MKIVLAILVFGAVLIINLCQILSPGRWLPHHGFLFLPTLLGLALVIGGAEVLLGPGQTFRLGGLLARIASPLQGQKLGQMW